MAFSSSALLGILHGSGFTDDVDLNISRVFHFRFNLLGNIAGQHHHVVVVDRVWLDHYAHFAPSLNRKGFFDTIKGGGDFFQLFQPLYVGDKCFSPCAGLRMRINLRLF